MISLALHFSDGYGPFEVVARDGGSYGSVMVTEKPALRELGGSPSPYQAWQSVGLFFKTPEAAQIVGGALQRAFEIDLAADLGGGAAAKSGAGEPTGAGPATERTDVLG